MFKEDKRYIAVIMIVVLAVAMVLIYAANRHRLYDRRADYEAAVLRQQEQRAAKQRDDETKAVREQEAADAIALAAAVHVPGVVFYGTKLGEDEVGFSLPLIVESLISQNVYDTGVGIVNVLDPHETALQKTYLPVVFICSDAWNGNVEALIARQKELIAGRERYIVLGMPSGTKESMEYLETSMLAEYGDKYINLREYLSTEGMASINLSIYPEDTAAMSEGRVPPGLLAENGVDLNESGYKLAAFLTYDRMDQLGYFDEVNRAIDEYNKERDS